MDDVSSNQLPVGAAHITRGSGTAFKAGWPPHGAALGAGLCRDGGREGHFPRSCAGRSGATLCFSHFKHLSLVRTKGEQLWSCRHRNDFAVLTPGQSRVLPWISPSLCAGAGAGSVPGQPWHRRLVLHKETAGFEKCRSTRALLIPAPLRQCCHLLAIPVFALLEVFLPLLS